MDTLLTEIPQMLMRYLHPFAVDVLRLVVWLVVLLVTFALLERAFPLHKQKVFRDGFLADLGYYFLNSLLPKFVLIAAAAVLARGLHVLVPGTLLAWSASLPLPARFAAAMIVSEIGFYWGHRLSHEIPLLWRFHAVHHSAETMDWLVNTRAHPIDIVFIRLCGVVPLYVTGLGHPMTRALDVVPLLVVVVGTFWGFLIHANFRWRLAWLGWLIATPAFHHWHHTNDDRRDRNYAAMLPVFDRIFGTYHVPAKRWPAEYGIDAPIAAGLTKQLTPPGVEPVNQASGALKVCSRITRKVVDQV